MASVARSYEDFVPLSEFIEGEGSDTIVLELPGFKKEHLKVQLDNYGNLRISGERPVNGNRWRRFRKEFRLPDSCNASEIRAKFENGILTLALPKLISVEPAQVTAPPPTQVPEPQAMPKPHEPEPEPEKTEEANDKKKVEEDVMKEEKGKYGVGGLMVGMKTKRRQLMINIVVAVVIMVGVGIYVAYKFRKIEGAESTVGLLEYLDDEY